MKTIKPQPMFNRKEEIRNQRIIAIVCFIALFLIIVSSHAQVVRTQDVFNGKEYVCKTPSAPLAFKLLNDNNDTLYLWIVADSVTHPIYSIMLYSRFTSGILPPDKGIRIWFYPGDSYLDFEPIQVGDGAIRYNVIGNSLSHLFKKEVVAIDFKGVLYAEGGIRRRYFMDFLALYDK